VRQFKGNLAQLPGRPHFQGMQRRTQINVGYLIFAFFAMLLLQQWWQILTREKEVLERWARKLLEKETLVEAELRRSLAAAPQPAPA
jgi:hypothetical protein